jgi:hypothetical protein
MAVTPVEKVPTGEAAMDGLGLRVWGLSLDGSPPAGATSDGTPHAASGGSTDHSRGGPTGVAGAPTAGS